MLRAIILVALVAGCQGAPAPTTERSRGVLIREPRKAPPTALYPSAEGRRRANTVSFVTPLLNQSQHLVFAPRRLTNGCRVVRSLWREHHVNGMSHRPLHLAMRSVNGTNTTTLPIERLSRTKTPNVTIPRAYVDDDVWGAKDWHFFDLGATFFLRAAPPHYGKMFQVMCGYPGAERFKYHAVAVNHLHKYYPPFVRWTTGYLWNESGHVLLRGDEDTSSAEFIKGSSDAGSDSGSGSGETVRRLPAVDIAAFIKDRTKPDDFVLVSITVADNQQHIWDRLFDSGAIDLVDEVFLECKGEITDKVYKAAKLPRSVPANLLRTAPCRDVLKRLRSHGVYLHEAG